MKQLTIFCRILKKDLHLQCKNYRNLLSTLLKDSKNILPLLFQRKYLEISRKKGKILNLIISMKSKSNDIPLSTFNSEQYITESATIANIFNDFCHSVAPAIQSQIRFSYKSSTYYLPSNNYDSFSKNSTTKAEIDVITSFLNRSTGPNCIPLKIFKLIQNEISQHLASTCLSFSKHFVIPPFLCSKLSL